MLIMEYETLEDYLCRKAAARGVYDDWLTRYLFWCYRNIGLEARIRLIK